MPTQSRRSVCSGTITLLFLGVLSMFWVSTVRANLPVDDIVKQGVEFGLPILKETLKDSLGNSIESKVLIALTDLVASNVIKSFGKGDEKKPSELIAHFREIQKELEQHKEELQFINREIQKLTLSVTYSKHEENIKVGLWNLREYLENFNEQNRKRFIKKAADLEQSIRVLIEGLLGQHALSPDIMAVIRDSSKCHGQMFRKNVKSIESLIMTGLHVRREYHRINKVTDWDSSSPFKEYIQTSVKKLNKRLHDMLIKCQADEKNVSDEMRHIIDDVTFTMDRKIVARSLLKFMEEKYDTKKWIVIVQQNNSKSLDSVWTGKFHYVSVGIYTIFAISVDPEGHFSEFKTLIDVHMKEFVIPAKITFRDEIQCSNPSEIEEYLHRFLIPVRAKSDLEMETLVSKIDFQNVFILASNGVEDPFISMQDRASNGIHCKKKVLVIVVPTRQITFNQSPSAFHLQNPVECSYDPDNAADNYGPLRNEYSQAYLSVKGDSDKEGASIVMDREWRNSPGQKWKFVNGQLKNGFGKCFTKSWGVIIYQYDCNHNWDGQKWYRHGLHIAHGCCDTYYCLDFNSNLNINLFVTLPLFKECNSFSSFVWYNRNTDCEDTMVIPSSTNGSRALRNEFSRLFLSAVIEKYGTVKPWMNRPSQLWKFVDGLLRNDDGKCLVGKGWYVEKVACDADKMGNNGLWTYTENRQIRSYDGYCLSNGDEEGYVKYNFCIDEVRQRWR